MTTLPMSPRRRNVGRVFVWALVAVIVICVAGAVWIGLRVVAAQSHLQTAREIASGLQSNIAADPAKAADAIPSLVDETGAARDLTSDVIWQAAEQLPWIGPQLHAVSTLAASLDGVAKGALTPLADVVANLDVEAFLPRGGAIDTEPFTAIRQPAAQAAGSARTAADELADIDSAGLVGALRDPVSEASELLTSVATATESIANASALLPAMLGTDEPRDYLVLFQNNAEWRSLGGMPGAVISIHTENGRITLGEQDTASQLKQYDKSVLPLADDVRALFGERPGRWMQNVTQVPDFSVAAQLAQEFWKRKHGTEVDGVIAVDPVALSYLLGGTGSVRLTDGTEVTSENAADLLLNEVYLRYEQPAEQDAFFGDATVAVFNALTSGAGNPQKLIDGLVRASSENRLLIWSAHDQEQSVLDGTTLQGGLPVTDDTSTRFGVYVNDGTGSKMDYYMRLNTDATWCGTSVDGADTASLRVTLRSDAPKDAADLPAWVTGNGWYGVDRGTARTIAYVYLPEGAVLLGTEASADRGFGGGSHDGRQVVSWSVDLKPGEEASFDVLVETPHTPNLSISQTPTLNVAETTPGSATCEFAP